jgi:WD40 repeat protein
MKIQTLGGNINMDWSPCGNYLAVGNKSDYVVVVDVRTGNQLKKKKFHYEVSNSFEMTLPMIIEMVIDR